MCHNQGFTKVKNQPVLVTAPTSTGSFCFLGKAGIIGRIHRSPCPWAIRLHDDSSAWTKLKKSICKRLLLCMRMTIGMGVKPLFVSYANHYRTECERLLHRAFPPTASRPRLRSNHPFSSSQKRWFEQKYILIISHLDTYRTTDDIP